MRKHTRRFATTLATTVAVSLSAFGLAVSASATTTDAPFIESARFSSSCFDNGPGAEGVIDVVIPEGNEPVVVSVEYGSGQVLFDGTLSSSGQVSGGGALPLGDYDLTILLNGTPTGSGLVSAVSCEEVANPGGETDNSGGSTDTPVPTTTPTPVAVVAPIVKTPVANIVPKGNTDGYDMQSASGESSPVVDAAGMGVLASALSLLGLLALVNWRRKTPAGK